MKASRLDLACCMYGALDILEKMIFLLKYGFLKLLCILCTCSITLSYLSKF